MIRTYVVLSCIYVVPVWASTPIQFDINTLKSLGYSEEIADFFSLGNNFLPGPHDVTLHVNAQTHHKTTVTFNESGQMCVDKSLLNLLNVREEALFTHCESLEELYPGAKVTPNPNEFSVDILLPESAFDPDYVSDNLSRGGNAVIFNYNLYSMYMSSARSQHFYQGQFETGINLSNWVLRNKSSMASGDNRTRYQFGETRLTHSIESLRTRLEVGQIQSDGELFGGVPILGMMLHSDSAQLNSSELIVPITGFASTAATVEVSQRGHLLYRTLVPMGPFTLNNVANIITGIPVDVEVIQEDGNRQRFSVTTSLNESYGSKLPRYTLSIGRYRKQVKEDHVRQPVIVNSEINLTHNDLRINGALLFSEPYQSLGGRISRIYDSGWSFSGGALYANSRKRQGQQFDFSSQINVKNVSWSLSGVYRTANYPSLEETLQKESKVEEANEREGNRLSLSSSLSWINMNWGVLGYSINHSTFYGKQRASITHSLTYGRRIGAANVNFNIQKDSSNNKLFFLNISFPLFSGTLNGQAQYYRNKSILGTRYNSRINDTSSYALGVNHSTSQTSITGNLNATTPYNQLSLSASYNDNNSHSFMAAASGGLAYSNTILATSAYPISDTFAIVRVPDQSGIKVNAPNGQNTTNYFGNTMISSLPAYRKSSIYLDTSSLPLNVRLDTTSFDIAAARGAVVTNTINATVIKELLLRINMPNGELAPMGTVATDLEGKFIGIVMGGGNLMLSNEQIGKSIKLLVANQNNCLIHYTEPDNYDEEQLYVEVPVLCQ